MNTTEQKIKRMNGLGRLTDPETNPCIKEHYLTNECLMKNKYDKKQCEIYFENYRNCKKFWLMVQLQRKRNGVYPHLPNREEREKIVEERRKEIGINNKN